MEQRMYKEEWRDIKGYEGLYKISNAGNIYSYNVNRELKLQTDKDGYAEAKLWKGGKVKYFRVHRLVAEAFISNELNKPCVNHINSIRNDNRVQNLEWVTFQENNIHALNYGNREYSTKEHMSDMSNKRWERDMKRVLMFDKEGNFIQEFKNINEASKVTKIKQNLIRDTCGGFQKSTHGFIFKYK